MAAPEDGAGLFQLPDLAVDLGQDFVKSHGVSYSSCQVMFRPGE
jgi:hypothetical protein